MATALVKGLRDYSQGHFEDRRPRAPDRKVGDFVPHTEPSNLGADADSWATVVFQVFWWPHDLPDGADMGKQRVVLLGEAVCPPMSSLTSSFRAYRLPLNQFQRCPPIDAAPFESLHSHLEKYVESIRQKFGEKPEVSKKQEELKRQEDLYSLEQDLLQAFPGSFSGLAAEPEKPDKNLCSEVKSPEETARYRPDPIEAKEDPLLKDLPAAFRGHCCLDVDLAFVGPADPRKALPVGHDGTLAFEVRSLRVPPLDHGYVSLRVCEAARLPSGTVTEPEDIPKRTESTENGAVLEREMLKNRRHQAPKLSRCRALWSSGSVLLGSWAGAILAPCCTAMWSMRKASASLWIASQQEVLRAAKQDTLPDTARELLNFRKVTPFVIPVTNEWVPVRLQAAEPLPRCRELLHVGQMERESPCKARGRTIRSHKHVG